MTHPVGHKSVMKAGEVVSAVHILSSVVLDYKKSVV